MDYSSEQIYFHFDRLQENTELIEVSDKVMMKMTAKVIEQTKDLQ